MMIRFRTASLFVFVLACLLLVPRPVLAGQSTCLTGTDPAVADDAPQLRAVRDAVDAACPCASFDGTAGKTHKDYVNCAKGVIAAAAPASLRTQCKGAAKAFVVRSTCGSNPALHAQPCIETNVKTGKIKCQVRALTKKDGSTPTNVCVSSSKASRESCAEDTHCVDAADVNDDLLVAAPGDDGRCRPMDCDAQLTRDVARCDEPTAACEQRCFDSYNFPSCYEGCMYGVMQCNSRANLTHGACATDPRQGCDAVRTSTIARCNATDFDASCQYTHYFDVLCADAINAFWGATCSADADDAWAQCRGAE